MRRIEGDDDHAGGEGSDEVDYAESRDDEGG